MRSHHIYSENGEIHQEVSLFLEDMLDSLVASRPDFLVRRSSDGDSNVTTYIDKRITD
jgi:hypothetical protein